MSEDQQIQKIKRNNPEIIQDNSSPPEPIRPSRLIPNISHLRTCCILSKSKHGRCVRCERWPRGGRRRGDTAQWNSLVGGLLLSCCCWPVNCAGDWGSAIEPEQNDDDDVEDVDDVAVCGAMAAPAAAVGELASLSSSSSSHEMRMLSIPRPASARISGVTER